VSKHRRPPASPAGRAASRLAERRATHRLPEPLGDVLLWGVLAAVVVPLVLVWAGASWATALGVAVLLAALVGICVVALRFSGVAVRAGSDLASNAERDDA
jgi:hypothetical protein